MATKKKPSQAQEGGKPHEKKPAAKRASANSAAAAGEGATKKRGRILIKGKLKGKSTPLNPLVLMVKKKLAEINRPEREFAQWIGVSAIYWHSVANNLREISSLGKDKVEKLAQFLGIPTLQAMNMSGHLNPQDYTRDQLGPMLDNGLTMMQRDPNWIDLAPRTEEWEKLSINTRMGIVLLYQVVFERTLLNLTDLADEKLGIEAAKLAVALKRRR